MDLPRSGINQEIGRPLQRLAFFLLRIDARDHVLVAGNEAHRGLSREADVVVDEKQIGRLWIIVQEYGRNLTADLGEIWITANDDLSEPYPILEHLPLQRHHRLIGLGRYPLADRGDAENNSGAHEPASNPKLTSAVRCALVRIDCCCDTPQAVCSIIAAPDVVLSVAL